VPVSLNAIAKKALPKAIIANFLIYGHGVCTDSVNVAAVGIASRALTAMFDNRKFPVRRGPTLTGETSSPIVFVVHDVPAQRALNHGPPCSLWKHFKSTTVGAKMLMTGECQQLGALRLSPRLAAVCMASIALGNFGSRQAC